jgi:hypothetical protein
VDRHIGQPVQDVTLIVIPVRSRGA